MNCATFGRSVGWSLAPAGSSAPSTANSASAPSWPRWPTWRASAPACADLRRTSASSGHPGGSGGRLTIWMMPASNGSAGLPTIGRRAFRIGNSTLRPPPPSTWRTSRALAAHASGGERPRRGTAPTSTLKYLQVSRKTLEVRWFAAMACITLAVASAPWS